MIEEMQETPSKRRGRFRRWPFDTTLRAYSG
jgi:hypothetical protein